MPDTNPPRGDGPPLAPPFTASDATTAEIGGLRLLAFAGCNYLGLAHHPRVVEAARGALSRFGLSASASRRTSGNTELHESLERELAEFLGRDAGLLTPDGYIANLAAAQALAEDHQVALLDERAHLSLRDAARCAGMRVHTYRHLDADDAADRAARLASRGVVIMTDGVFAAHGAIAPTPRLVDALPARGARLLVDDCHGFCVLGDRGRGSLDHFELDDPRVVVTTTLAKGLGCAGGVIAADESLIARARARASAFVCTTPPSPALVAAGLEALRVMREDALRFQRLTHNIERARDALASCGLHAHDAPVPVFAIDLGRRGSNRALAEGLREGGVFVPLVGYPGGPSPEYLRLSVNAEHTPEQIDALRKALASLTPGLSRASSA